MNLIDRMLGRWGSDPRHHPLVGPFRYLIAIDNSIIGKTGEIFELGYSAQRPQFGRYFQYGNLYAQEKFGRYGPFLEGTDTSKSYGECVVDPRGYGWPLLLRDQADKARAVGAEGIELDNPDGYDQDTVVAAVDYMHSRGLTVLAKNPLGCPWDPTPYVGHPAVVGVVVERGAGSPADMHALRVKVGKPGMMIAFVAFGDGATWAYNLMPLKNMWVTLSRDGEYTSSEDVKWVT